MLRLEDLSNMMNLSNLLSKMMGHEGLNMASLEAGLIARRENSLFALI
jgi:hypothetical protein